MDILKIIRGYIKYKRPSIDRLFLLKESDYRILLHKIIDVCRLRDNFVIRTSYSGDGRRSLMQYVLYKNDLKTLRIILERNIRYKEYDKFFCQFAWKYLPNYEKQNFYYEKKCFQKTMKFLKRKDISIEGKLKWFKVI
jgi:hypothetical protein